MVGGVAGLVDNSVDGVQYDQTQADSDDARHKRPSVSTMMRTFHSFSAFTTGIQSGIHDWRPHIVAWVIWICTNCATWC